MTLTSNVTNFGSNCDSTPCPVPSMYRRMTTPPSSTTPTTALSSSPPVASPSPSSVLPQGHTETHKNNNLQIILPCALVGGLFIMLLFGLGAFTCIHRKKRKAVRIRGGEEEADSPQKPQGKGYQYISGDIEDRREQQSSDIPLLHNDHTPSPSSVSVSGFVSDLNLVGDSSGSESRSHLMDSDELPNSIIIPGATSMRGFSTVNPATKVKEQYSIHEIHPASQVSLFRNSSLPAPPSPSLKSTTSRTDTSPLIPPNVSKKLSPRPYSDLQRAESQTSRPPVHSKPILFAKSKVSINSDCLDLSPRKLVFSRFSGLSSSSSEATSMSPLTLRDAFSKTSSYYNQRRVLLGQNRTYNEPGENVEPRDQGGNDWDYMHMLHAHSRSNSYSRQEIEVREEDERSLSVARFSPNSSVKTIYAI